MHESEEIFSITQWKRIVDEIEGRINAAVSHEREYIKSVEKSIYAAFETLETSTNFSIKDLNFRLGSLRGRENRKSDKEQEPVFVSVQDAVAYANAIRKEQGLKPIDLKIPDENTNSQ